MIDTMYNVETDSTGDKEMFFVNASDVTIGL